MGYGYDAICKACGTKFQINEGGGMIAVPLHCDVCGKEWWWEFGPGGPIGEPKPPPCECGGSFSLEAPARCPNCRSMDYEHNPDGVSVIYD